MASYEIDFLAEDNVAGQTLLRLVSRGSAIIAELLRLSKAVPKVFYGSDREAQKYSQIIFDFKYLDAVELYDQRIDGSEALSEIDEEFQENHLPILERFYQLFDSVFKYVFDLRTYIEEMKEGVFLQHTMEGILMGADGKQLMTEAIYLYGVMLLVMDITIPGIVRERLIVCYYRYKGSSQAQNINEVIRLCRRTGFTAGEKRPKGYPEKYFARIAPQQDIVEMIVGRLRSDDVYNLGMAYPSPQHRSFALSQQAAMLYVILFFCPQILQKQQAVMREIVDKHFSDNWVISFYMGFIVDLQETFEPYKAATKALNNTMHKSNVAELSQKHAAMVPKLSKGLRQYLTDGVLTEDYVVDNINKLLESLREFNTTLRWLMLHRLSSNKKIREPIFNSVSTQRLLLLLMQIAQFEFKLKNIFGDLLKKKNENWEMYKKECMDRMTELSEYFSGEKALTRVKKDVNLQDYFKKLSAGIGDLDYNKAVKAGRKIVKMLEALKDLEDFHQVIDSLQVKQFLLDTRDYLNKMVRTVNVRDEIMATIQIISDFSYAWETIREYVPLMHTRIKEDPNSVLLLRATFLKLVSIIDLPLVRINQCGSKDVVSVAGYYSGELVAFVRKVLEVIPVSMFQLLNDIVVLKSSKLKEIPMKVEREHLREYAQLDERYELARTTHRVSVFTEGILNMEQTLFGIIEVDPKKMLVDGLRKELVRQISTALHHVLQFKTGKVSDFEHRIQQIGSRLESFVSSFEYIQDYVNVYGLKIWQEEFSRIINYHVQQESNRFLKKKIYDWQSTYQSDAIPIPVFPPLPKDPCNNFLGRLVQEILAQTHPVKTVYVDSMQGWYDQNGRECIGIRTFDLINKGVGIFGLAGLDRLMCFMIVKDLQDFVHLYRTNVGSPIKKFINELRSVLHPVSRIPLNSSKLYKTAREKTVKLWPNFLASVVRLGQKQLLRRQISHELNFASKLDSKILSCSLDTINTAVVTDIRKHYLKPEQNPYPDEDSEFLAQLASYLDTAGFNISVQKIYITTEPLEGFAGVMFLFVLYALSKLQWEPRLDVLIRKGKNEFIDGAPLVVGILTVMKQFHSSHTVNLLAYLGQFVRASVNTACGSDKPEDEIPLEVRNVLIFCEEFCRFGGLPRKIVDVHIPPYMFDQFRHEQ